MLAAALLAERLHVMARPRALYRAALPSPPPCARSVSIEIVHRGPGARRHRGPGVRAACTPTFGPPVTLSAPLGADHVSVRIDPTRRGAQAMTLRTSSPRRGCSRAPYTVTATLSSAQVAALRLTLRLGTG